MKKLIIMSLVLILIPFSLTAAGKKKIEKEKLVHKGTQVISPSLSIGRNFGSTTTTLEFGYGYFVTDWARPEAALGLSISDNADAEYFLVGASFYYNQGWPVLPFIGLRIGVVSVNLDGFDRSTSFITAPKCGFMVPINKNVGVTATFEYQRWSRGVAGVAGSNHFSFPVGFSVYF